MDVEIKTIKTYTLTMNEDEALWLKGMVQNQIGVQEEVWDAEMRKRIFFALTKGDTNARG